MYKVVKEVGSGVNDSRRKLLAILADPTITVIVVEHKDRLTRFGFRYIETLLAVQGRRIEVVNVSENPIEDLMADLVSISYSFCSRLSGQRRAKRKTEKIVKALGNQKTASNDNHFDERKKEEVKEKIAERQAIMSMQAKQVARKNKKKRKASEPRYITRAVTPIRLNETNAVKLAALDALAPVYISLCQQYVTLFCTEELPNKLRDPLYETPLSERWHRVAIMQAAGIAKSWRSNRANAVHDYEREQEKYEERLAEYQNKIAQGREASDKEAIKEPKAPVWREWNIPMLREWCLQTNANVAKLEPSEESTFDYWLTIATLEKGHPIKIPVKLADYHKEALKQKKLNSSVSLNKRNGDWWLTVTYDEEVSVKTEPDAPVVGIDVGIANFITTSTGKHYGTMHGKLKERHKRDRAKRRRKAKLRACLEKKGVKKLPSTSSRTGQKLIRQTKQEINRAVNECFNDPEHAGVQFAYEELSVASMRFKARAMNAYLRASNLAHIPQQIKWNAEKRGGMATPVISAYSSQECSVCHYTDRKNRPDQQTFCCQVCGFKAHADFNASANLSRRVGDKALQACHGRDAIKSLLMKRHERWKQEHGLGVSQKTRQKRRGKASFVVSVRYPAMLHGLPVV